MSYLRLSADRTMLYSIIGTVISKGANFVVLEAAGIGFKVFTNQRTLEALPDGVPAKLFSHLQVKEDGMDLYGLVPHPFKKPAKLAVIPV